MITTSTCALSAFIFLCIGIGTEKWLNMTELRKPENAANVTRYHTYTGLWRRCNYTEGKSPTCTYIYIHVVAALDVCLTCRQTYVCVR